MKNHQLEKDKKETKMIFCKNSFAFNILFKNYIMLVKEVRRYYEKTTSDIGVSIH